MKTTNPLLLIILATALALTGCGKKAESNSATSTPMGSLMKLQKSFSPAPPDIQASLEKATMGIRYGQYETALAELDKLAANTTLNDAQKKAVSEAIESIKKAMATPKPAP